MQKVMPTITKQRLPTTQKYDNIVLVHYVINILLEFVIEYIYFVFVFVQIQFVL